MHAVPSGQVVLAEADERRFTAYIAAPMASFTQHTLVDGASLRQRLAEVRRDGYAWAIEEFAPGLSSVAAGIRDRSGVLVAALHVYGPAYRFPGERDRHELGVLVAERAAAITIA
jgi:DNA-binding IclR family transcriptional regulator